MAKGISRERIVDTALDLLDEQGIEGVTARALAQRLGVQAPALYWHVRSKSEIIDEMGTAVSRRVVAAMSTDEVPDGWRDGLAHYARVLRQEYLVHRDAARTFAGFRVTDPDVLRAQESWLVRWTRSGLTPEQVGAAAQLVTSFVVGFVIEEQERAYPHFSEADAALAADVPLISRVRPTLFTHNDERFERYLDMVLAGIALRLVPGEG